MSIPHVSRETFTPHDGGECPVPPGAAVIPVYRGPEDRSKGLRIACAPARRLDWSHDGGPDDIVGYEMWEPA